MAQKACSVFCVVCFRFSSQCCAVFKILCAVEICVMYSKRCVVSCVIFSDLWCTGNSETYTNYVVVVFVFVFFIISVCLHV